MSEIVERPVPEVDDASRPFFEGAAAGRLVLQRCNTCQAVLWPVKSLCDRCLSRDIGWGEVSGRGHLHSFAVVHQARHPGLAADTPFSVALVELEEGLRIVSNVVDVAPDTLEDGQPLQVDFRSAGGVAYPVFKPAGRA